MTTILHYTDGFKKDAIQYSVNYDPGSAESVAFFKIMHKLKDGYQIFKP